MQVGGARHGDLDADASCVQAAPNRLNVAASIFMGQTEAPLTIRPFIAGLTESELFTIMTSGMAHVSGAVMAAYVKIAGVDIKHLLTAVIMTAPATIMLAKMLDPRDRDAGHRRQRQGRGRKDRRQHHRCGGAAVPAKACISPSTSAAC